MLRVTQWSAFAAIAIGVVSDGLAESVRQSLEPIPRVASPSAEAPPVPAASLREPRRHVVYQGAQYPGVTSQSNQPGVLRGVTDGVRAATSPLIDATDNAGEWVADQTRNAARETGDLLGRAGDDLRSGFQRGLRGVGDTLENALPPASNPYRGRTTQTAPTTVAPPAPTQPPAGWSDPQRGAVQPTAGEAFPAQYDPPGNGQDAYARSRASQPYANEYRGAAGDARRPGEANPFATGVGDYPPNGQPSGVNPRPPADWGAATRPAVTPIARDPYGTNGYRPPASDAGWPTTTAPASNPWDPAYPTTQPNGYQPSGPAYRPTGYGANPGYPPASGPAMPGGYGAATQVAAATAVPPATTLATGAAGGATSGADGWLDSGPDATVPATGVGGGVNPYPDGDGRGATRGDNLWTPVLLMVLTGITAFTWMAYLDVRN
ncbi:MAG: hypothetical protein AAF805_11870, partial [Planctomycetota bacterium]